MSEMIERVALALATAEMIRFHGPKPGPEARPHGVNADWWERSLGMAAKTKAAEARIAIEAMREPTREMVCAGDGKDPGFGSRSEAIFGAMIEEALKCPA